MAIKRAVYCAAFLILGYVLGCWASSRKLVTVPTTSVRVSRPLACDARLWGNAVELDCKDGAEIVYVQPLKQASPK